MIRRPPRSTPLYSSAASDVYKRQVKNSEPSSVKEVNSEKVADKDKVASTEEQSKQPQRRKAIVFASSIAKKMDKERLEKELCCEVEIVPTYHIRENAGAKDPEKYLGKMFSDNMSAEIDFVIISVGSNDISSLDMK